MRSARTSRMRALVCEVSVTIPACEPVSEIAWWPRSLIAIAHSAHEIRSPVESSMSISRGSGVGETSSAIAISSSVVLPRAESTATTRWPASRLVDDPPRGALDPLGVGDRGAAELHHDQARHGRQDDTARRSRPPSAIRPPAPSPARGWLAAWLQERRFAACTLRRDRPLAKLARALRLRAAARARRAGVADGRSGGACAMGAR